MSDGGRVDVCVSECCEIMHVATEGTRVSFEDLHGWPEHAKLGTISSIQMPLAMYS